MPTFLKGKKCLENISENTNCYLIENNSKQTLWLLGDSHAGALALAGEEVANALRMNMKLYTAAGTAFPPVSKYRKAEYKVNLQRLNDFKFVEKEVYRQIKFGDVILLSMRMPFHFGETYFDDWIASVVNLANMAQRQGTKVIIQTPTPEWEEEELNNSCTKNEWFNISQKRNCQIESKFFIGKKRGVYKHLFEKLNGLSSSHENIYLFDTYKIVCPESTCSFIKNGFEIYLDHNHLSLGWARDILAPEISKFINEIQTIDK